MELKIIKSKIERIRKSNLGIDRFFDELPKLLT